MARIPRIQPNPCTTAAAEATVGIERGLDPMKTKKNWRVHSLVAATVLMMGANFLPRDAVAQVSASNCIRLSGPARSQCNHEEAVARSQYNRAISVEKNEAATRSAQNRERAAAKNEATIRTQVNRAASDARRAAH